MSKVEKALQKARAMEGLQPVTALVTSTEPAASQPLVSTSTELRPYVADITRMVETWRLSEADLAESKIIYPEMQDQRVIDAFRGIRTRIVQRAVTSNSVVLVTSLAEHGGSSFVALNLAVSFTLDERKSALLVDCNLRRPALEHLVSKDMHYGLTDFLESQTIEPQQIIHPVGIPRLRLVPAGRRSEIPTEQLGSARMKELVSVLRGRYPDRYVVLDVSSVSVSADMQVLSDLADFILLVVPYGMARDIDVWNAANSIDENKFLGVVFNNEPQLPRFYWN